MKELVTVKDLVKIYRAGGADFYALKKISFYVLEGEFCVVLGPSGSGKSTLMNIIGGIDRPSGGSVTIMDTQITALNDNALTEFRREHIGIVFQFYNLIPSLTIKENVEVAANIAKNPLDIDEVLDSVGILDQKNKFPSKLSGGQQQRVAIARAVVKNAKLLICDEPTGALDYENSIEVLKLLRNINKKYNTTVLLVTHNSEIAKMADRIMALKNGEIVKNQVNQNILQAHELEW
ncbi:MAG: ABC transporter ATP-binding protein [Clostridiales bacterium]|jgi:putative ABC transport system ATP-binding protein|nr:ABC transporter ATP-binding protein [Clostridiales bacterium]